MQRMQDDHRICQRSTTSQAATDVGWDVETRPGFFWFRNWVKGNSQRAAERRYLAQEHDNGQTCPKCNALGTRRLKHWERNSDFGGGDTRWD